MKHHPTHQFIIILALSTVSPTTAVKSQVSGVPVNKIVLRNVSSTVATTHPAPAESGFHAPIRAQTRPLPDLSPEALLNDRIDKLEKEINQLRQANAALQQDIDARFAALHPARILHTPENCGGGITNGASLGFPGPWQSKTFLFFYCGSDFSGH